MSNVALGCRDRMLCAYSHQRLKTSQHVLHCTELVVSFMPGQRLQSFKVCAVQVSARFPLSCDSRLSKAVVCSGACYVLQYDLTAHRIISFLFWVLALYKC